MWRDETGHAYDWVPGDALNIPEGAVIGGHTTDNHPVYIVKFDDTIASFDARNTFAEINRNGVTHVDIWDYLRFYYGNHGAGASFWRVRSSRGEAGWFKADV